MNDTKDTQTTEENIEIAADVITAQPYTVKCGDKTYTLIPRTLHQMRAINKVIVDCTVESVNLLATLIGLEDEDGKAAAEQNEAQADKANDAYLDMLIKIIQMLLDDKPIYDPEDPPLTYGDIDMGMNMVDIDNLISAAADMHDIRPILAKTQRLRVV